MAATPQLTIPESNVGGTSAGLVGRQFHVEVCNNSVDDDNDGTVDEGVVWEKYRPVRSHVMMQNHHLLQQYPLNLK